MAFVLPQFSLGSLSRSWVYAAKAGRCCQGTVYSMDFRENLADWMFTTQPAPCGVHSIQNGCRLMINLSSLGTFLTISKIAFLGCVELLTLSILRAELGNVIKEQAMTRFWGWMLLLSVCKAGFPLNTKGSKIVWLKGSVNTCHKLSKLYLITRVVWEKQSLVFVNCSHFFNRWMVSTHLWSYLKLQRHDQRREGTERFGTDASSKENEQVGVAGRNMKSFKDSIKRNQVVCKY